MKGMMKAARKVRREPGMDLVDTPIPAIRPNEVLVKVGATAICGSDIHFYNWDEYAQSRLKPPLTLGHEFAGEIVEVGAAVTDYKLGDHVTADSHIVCGKCDVCKMGLQHICANLKIFGNEVDGSFAEYVAVPETSLVAAAQGPPLGCRRHHGAAGRRRAGGADRAGDGPVGGDLRRWADRAYSPPAWHARLGARKVYLVGMVPERLEIARRMGADQVFNISDPVDPVKAILEETRVGADVVVEMAGAAASIKNAFATVRKGGRVTTFGLTPKPIEFDINYAITLRQVRVCAALPVGTCGTPGGWRTGCCSPASSTRDRSSRTSCRWRVSIRGSS